MLKIGVSTILTRRSKFGVFEWKKYVKNRPFIGFLTANKKASLA
jgi:hypothetical protein